MYGPMREVDDELRVGIRAVVRLLLIAAAAVSRVATAQVGTDLQSAGNGDEVAPVLLSAAVWEQGELPGMWTVTSRGPEEVVHEARDVGRVFGYVPQVVQAYTEGDRVKQIVVVYLESGRWFGFKRSVELQYQRARDSGERREQRKSIKAAQSREKREYKEKREGFKALFRELERRLPVEIRKLTDAPSRRRSVGRSSMVRARVAEFCKDDIVMRLQIEDDLLVSLTFMRSADADRDLLATGRSSRDRQKRRADIQDNVVTRSNGDVVVENIPMVNQGNRGYCAMGVLTMLARYYGLSIDIDQLAAKAGYREGEGDDVNASLFYTAVAREAKLRVLKTRSLTLRHVEKAILRGQPVIVFRAFSRERDAFHSDFATDYAMDPKLELPHAKEGRQDKKNWPRRGMMGHASLITGLNTKRDEILFTESWGEVFRNRRMSVAEMEATGTTFFFFTP